MKFERKYNVFYTCTPSILKKMQLKCAVVFGFII